MMAKLPSDDLTPAEAERLACLVDAASDVLKAVAKVQRHGYASVNEDQREFISNRDQLQAKVGEMEFILQMMADLGDISGAAAFRYHTAKGHSINAALHHNKFVAGKTA